MTTPNSDSTFTYLSVVRSRVEESIRVKQRLLEQEGGIVLAAGILVEAYRSGGKALFFGNGGSAADAQHIATELVGRYYLERPALPADALTVNTSSLTALGNDYSFDEVFARQVEAFGKAGDVAVALSTSGNSENVIRGVLKATEKGLRTVGLTGADGGRLRGIVECCICVPSRDTPRIQESHILIGHILCEIVEQSLFRA